MFSLFLNDIEMHLQEIINVGTIIYPGCIYLLLFADDAVLLSEDSHLGLEQMLDSLHGYCNKWICNMYDWLVDGLTEVKDLALNMC